ncbi:MAG: UDP-glucose/GDP-mannose dehydrogenase family protein [Deltaproteobacteria bacterium]|nr:UDP-glucose/GDP-mannose dehydrogenase family protein [Deltaproteobacteria bacterium]
MKIAIIGTGYVGLVTGACLAEGGNDVICVDINAEKVGKLKQGKLPFYEPGLEELVTRNEKEERLRFTTSIEEGVQNSLLIFIAVGTPPNDDGSSDLSAIFAVAEGIGKAINGYKIVITKSTVPVGTTRRIKEIISGLIEQQFDVVSNPEFLKEGNAVNDFMKPDRVVIGAEDVRVAEIIKELYAPFVRTEKPIIVMGIESAEMTKYTANALLATKISFMNEIANLCEQVGADVTNVRKGIGADKRIGYQFLFPGVGYGGSCFPKDVKALIKIAESNGYELKIAKVVDEVNSAQRERFFQKIYNHFDSHLERKKIAVWGLAFKPGTDDMREAPSIEIINKLLEHGAEVRAHDPKANGTAKAIFGEQITYFINSYDSLQNADALVLITEWPEFRNPDFEKMKELMKNPVVFDGRNIYNPVKLREMGFTYYGVGRL